MGVLTDLAGMGAFDRLKSRGSRNARKAIEENTNPAGGWTGEPDPISEYAKQRGGAARNDDQSGVLSSITRGVRRWKSRD